MNETRRITANIPEHLLEDAREITGNGITATLIEGLEMIRRRKAFQTAMRLKGKVNLAVDLKVSRERTRR